mgnify:CR=1 FL=1
MKKKLLGYVGVDSGQLLIADPCYIDSEWKKEDFADIRLYEHKKTKKKLMYQASAGYSKNKSTITREKAFKKTGGELFANYEAITSFKKSMNEMEASKEVKELPVPEKMKSIGHFSYAGSCETTMTNQHQLNYKLGHPGVAVTFNSGYGDGCYKVYGYFNKDNRCVKVEIIMK